MLGLETRKIPCLVYWWTEKEGQRLVWEEYIRGSKEVVASTLTFGDCAQPDLEYEPL